MPTDAISDDMDIRGADGFGVFAGLLFGALVWLLILVPLAFYL